MGTSLVVPPAGDPQRYVKNNNGEKMGDTWVSDIRHFLDADGMLHAELPGPAYRLANHLCSIVEAVSSRERDEIINTGVKCRRRPGRKPCRGMILAMVDSSDNFTIKWLCPECNDNGFISGWQGTLYDNSLVT